jgi:hypothetical protein
MYKFLYALREQLFKVVGASHLVATLDRVVEVTGLCLSWPLVALFVALAASGRLGGGTVAGPGTVHSGAALHGLVRLQMVGGMRASSQSVVFPAHHPSLSSAWLHTVA